MPKHPKINQEDITAFQKAVAGTKPLIHKNKVRPTFLAEPPTFKASITPPDEPLFFRESEDLDHVQGEEFIAFAQSGISNKTLRKLRKGQYNVDAMLDLHGKSVEEAKIAIQTFLQHCLQKKLKVVLIIHGKGRHGQMPILKNKLNHWLRELNSILAFCSAAPLHGSRGAIYVLLKNRVC
ncbi:MAG: Smr/MutS family protein [Gammaproteobacteria bacterium]|nr:Smr/MutS family protein [Gammaproteobacteria bacterium]